MSILRLSPHALTHYSDEWCQRCWYLAVKHGIKPPSHSFPEVVNVADQQMKQAFAGMDLNWLDIPGKAQGAKKTWVMSKPVEAHGLKIEIAGYVDDFIDLDGGLGIADYKMTVPRPKRAIQYEAQLNCYAYAVENPAESLPQRVNGLWIICWSPGTMAISPDPSHPQPFLGSVSAMPVKRVDGLVERLIEGHAKLLSGQLPPPLSDCPNCGYMSLVAAKAKELRTQAA